MSIQIGSRDLREVLPSPLHIRIEDIGEYTCNHAGFPTFVAVGEAFVAITGGRVYVMDDRCSPWEVAEFDREANRITVRQV